MKIGDIWYRYDVGNVYENNTLKVGVIERLFTVISVTKCGGWIVENKKPEFNDFSEFSPKYNKKRFVRDIHNKSYAHSTKEKAKISFLHRKSKQMEILQVYIKNIKTSFEKAKVMWGMESFERVHVSKSYDIDLL